MVQTNKPSTIILTEPLKTTVLVQHVTLYPTIVRLPKAVGRNCSFLLSVLPCIRPLVLVLAGHGTIFIRSHGVVSGCLTASRKWQAPLPGSVVINERGDRGVVLQGQQPFRAS